MFNSSQEFNEFVKSLVYQLEESRRTLGDLPNKTAGLNAEKTVQRILKKYNKYSKLTPNSESPADIISLKESKKIHHLSLIQVKSSVKNEKDIIVLDAEDIRALKNMIDITYETLIDKGYYRSNKQLLISTGYAGVYTGDNKKKIVTQDSFKYKTYNFDKSKKSDEYVDKYHQRLVK